MNAAIETRCLEFSYVDGTKALVEMNIAIPAGKRVAFLGPNGAGKTTLFLHFNGLIKPDQGKVYVAGQEVRYDRASLLEVRKKVGIVFQDPDTQLFSSSVRQEISFGPLNLGLSKDVTEKLVRQAMEDTGIVNLQDKPTHFLSYGQKKRVAIADILAMQPEVLICDEPTAWLDVKHARHVMEILTRCNGRGVTVIISTHDVEMAYSWADYIFVMKDGRVIGEGAPLEIFDDAELLKDAELARPLLYVLSGELVAKGCCDEGAPAKSVQELMKRIRDLNNCSPMSSGGNSYRWHKGKLLRRGYTTGTSAAAAGRAAVLVLKGEHPEQVEVLLPEGNYLNIEIAGIERCGNEAKAWVIKDGGDDPDITDGARIEVTARFLEEGIVIRGGKGVGVATKPGLAVPPGQAAINPVPLQMIRENVAAVLPPDSGAEITISVPEGERLAKKTMNPQLGVVGGISILGTTGIVEPMSEEAFKMALIPQLEIAKCAGCDLLLLTPGRRGVRCLVENLGAPAEAVIMTSNFVGFILEECLRQGFRRLILWGHAGKMVKVAAGVFHTHNRVADGRAEVVAALAGARGAGSDLIKEILETPTVEGMIPILKRAGLEIVWRDLAERASRRAVTYLREDQQLDASTDQVAPADEKNRDRCQLPTSDLRPPTSVLQVGTVIIAADQSLLGCDRTAVNLLSEAGWQLRAG
ncbi:MAG: cobalt-precorrin-5B (C(1))-methyltransferase CbiD, partial [Syntrophaceticus schinkii]|nr:cobalt-precorrin-5B (C(1))-methyltransferase CbiD [Syntrophaceticus schinkii]